MSPRWITHSSPFAVLRSPCRHILGRCPRTLCLVTHYLCIRNVERLRRAHTLVQATRRLRLSTTGRPLSAGAEPAVASFREPCHHECSDRPSYRCAARHRRPASWLPFSRSAGRLPRFTAGSRQTSPLAWYRQHRYHGLWERPPLWIRCSEPECISWATPSIMFRQGAKNPRNSCRKSYGRPR